MKRTTTVLYLLFGTINAFFAGLVALVGIDLNWNIAAVGITIAFVASAAILMRAPFSKKNIDGLTVVLFVRLPVILFLIYFEWCIVYGMLNDTCDTSLLLMAAVVAVTIFLHISITAARARIQM